MLNLLLISSTFSSILTFHIPLTFCILSLLSLIIFLFTYIRHERLRVNSGKIIFILVIVQIFLTSQFLASLFYEIEKTVIFFCLSIATNFLIYLFLGLHLALAHNLVCCLGQNGVKFEKRFKIYIFGSVLLSIAITTILACSNAFGQGLLGFTWMKGEDRSGIIGILTAFLMFPPIVGAIIYVYIKEHKLKTHSLYFYNEDNFTSNNRKTFVKINLGYTIVFVTTWSPCSLIYVIFSIYNFDNDDNTPDAKWFEILQAIALNFLCISAFAMFLVRVNEPIIKKALKKLFKGGFFKDNKPITNENSDSLEIKPDKKVLTMPLIDNEVPITSKQTNKRFIYQPMQYDILQIDSSNNISFFAMFGQKQKRSSIMRATSKSNVDKETKESKVFLLKILLAAAYQTKNNAESDELDIYKTIPPWEEQYYVDEVALKGKIDDIISFISKNNEKKMEDFIQILKENDENLLEKINIRQVANIFFSHLRFMYEIDNGKLFESLIPTINLNKIDNLIYDPFNINEDISFGNYMTYDNKFILMFMSLKRFNFFMTDLIQSLHTYISKTKANTFLAPLVSLYCIEFEKQRPYVAIFENVIAKIKKEDLYSLIIFDGLTVIQIKLVDGNIKNIESFVLNEFQLENGLKLRYKDKTILLKQLKNDMKFLYKNNLTNYQIHFIFSGRKSPDLFNDFNYQRRKDYNRFETYIEGFICKVTIVNYLNKSKENTLVVDNLSMKSVNSSNPGFKKSNPINTENFSIQNPENYAKTLMEAIQELL